MKRSCAATGDGRTAAPRPASAPRLHPLLSSLALAAAVAALCGRGADAVPVVSGHVNEAGSDGVRSSAGATITIAGASWNQDSMHAANAVRTALQGMTGQYLGCAACPTPDVPKLADRPCLFHRSTGTGSAIVPARVECFFQDDLYDIFRTATYTLAPWDDDLPTTWSSTTFTVTPNKGSAYVVGNVTSGDPGRLPAATQTLTEPASGAYVGGTVVVPSLIFTEEDIAWGGQTVAVTLLGESWNDGTVKAAVADWRTAVDFTAVTNPLNPLNPKGWTATKAQLLPTAGVSPYRFFSNWHERGEKDTLEATLTAADYEIAQHEVVQVAVAEQAVQSSAPAGGVPDSTYLAFEVWPVPGILNFTVPGPLVFTEEQMRSGSVSFDIVVTRDTWDPSFDWTTFRSSLNSDVPTATAPAGWQARRGIFMHDPVNIKRKSDTIVTVSLTADPGFDISGIETVSFDLPGCGHYRYIRVLPVGTLCTPDYVMKSQLRPITSALELQILPTQGTIAMAPSSVITECDVHAGTTVALTLQNEHWKSDDLAGVRTKLYELFVSDVSTAARPTGEPAGFNALKPFLIAGSGATGITFDSTFTTAYVKLGPSAAYDISRNETLDFADKLASDDPAAPRALFASGLMPSFIEGANGTLVIAPGPCHEINAQSTCRHSTTCGGASPCVCREWDELDVRAGKATLRLTLPFGETWAAAAALDVGALVWTSLAEEYRNPNGDSSQRSQGAAANMETNLPWGFLARLNATGDPPFVTLVRNSDSTVTLTFNDDAFDIPTDETVFLRVPGSFVASGVALEPALELTFRRNVPALTVTPSPFVVYNCELQGPAYRPPEGVFAADKAYLLLQASGTCASAHDSLGKQATAVACAQACYERQGCRYFSYGHAGTSDAEDCLHEKTTSDECPEGFLRANYGFHRLVVDRMRLDLTLNTGSWVVDGDDVRAAFYPQGSDFVRNVAPGINVVLPSNNTLMLELPPVPSFTLDNGEENVYIRVEKAMSACDCITTTNVPVTVRRCPGYVTADSIVFSEQDVWEGKANLTLRITGDKWVNETGWAFRSMFRAHDVPDATWQRHFNCIFQLLPDRVDDQTLVIPLGPCRDFDINTDALGNLGVLALADNTTALFEVGGRLTQSGVWPLGGNEIGFRDTNPAGVYLYFNSSQGVVRVVPDDTYNEQQVRDGQYRLTLQLDPGETFANPQGYDLRHQIRIHTRTVVNTHANGGGWDFLSTVLVDSVVIDATDPHKMHIRWRPNDNYNIDLPEYLCIEITQWLTASGLQPKGADGSYCVRPAPIVPVSGCVRMEPFPYTITEQDVRTNGFEFDLVLDNSETWVSTELEALIPNMSVAFPTMNMLGWEARKQTYSSSAFKLDSTRQRLTVHVPGTSLGVPIADPLYDIVEHEEVSIVIPEQIVGSRKAPCVSTPCASGNLCFNITSIPGSVHMVNSEFTEGEIRTSGGTVTVTIVGNTWKSPWTEVERTHVLAHLVPVCDFLKPGTHAFENWLPYGHPRQDLKCNHNWGFDTYKEHAEYPLVNVTLLQYNNDKLEIVMNPTPGYDIDRDEVVLIRIPTEITATGTFPENWNRLWFVIKADQAILPNNEERDASGTVTRPGIIVPGIPDEQIRAGTAPEVKIRLFNETWDTTEGARFKVGFCGSSGVCTDVSNPFGFNAQRDALWPLEVTFETVAGAACPPTCPASVAVVKFRPAPYFDVCAGQSEEIIVTLDPLTAASHPRTPPTSFGDGTDMETPSVLRFNIVGGAPPTGRVVNLKVDAALLGAGSSYGVDEDLIRGGGVVVTLSVHNGQWNTQHPDFITMLRDSVISDLPSTEVYSHAGPLKWQELMPRTLDEIDFVTDPGSTVPRHMVFNLSSVLYDIPSRSPTRDCAIDGCPFLTPTNIRDTLTCGDDTTCNVLTHADAFACCQANGGIKRCPHNWPTMCRDPVCAGNQYCCVDLASACITGGFGGTRVCNAKGCTAGETLSFDLNADLTVCKVAPPPGQLTLRIEGDSWGLHYWNTTSETYEGLNHSAYVEDTIPIHFEGWELHTINDTAALSLVPGCGTTDLVGADMKLQPTEPQRWSTPASYTFRDGPGLRAANFTPNATTPGIYDVCYKDFRVSAFTRVMAEPLVNYQTVTVIGQAFRYYGDWGNDHTVNVTYNEQDKTNMLTIEGRGLCTGDAPPGRLPSRTWAHGDADARKGCDSVKIMHGDVGCNPGMPTVHDDLSGRFGDPVALQPGPYDIPGTPRSVGYAAFDLHTRGTFSVCYMSRWGMRWQKLGTFEVVAQVRRWDACNPRSRDANMTLRHDGAFSADHQTPYTTPTCELQYEAVASKPQRIYFEGTGLTSTRDPAGKRARRRRYDFVGAGECAQPNPATHKHIAKCQMPGAVTYDACTLQCDIEVDCDFVDFRTATGACRLHFPYNDAMYSPQARGFVCIPDPHSVDVTPRAFGWLVPKRIPNINDISCFKRTNDTVSMNDTGDKVKVVRFGDDCETAQGPGDFVLADETPAVLNVTGDPSGSLWQTTARACKLCCSVVANGCRTKVTEAIWTFFAYGRYSFCYQAMGTEPWVLVPDTFLTVRAYVDDIDDAVDKLLVASQDPPTVWYYGTGFLRGEVEARMREWPGDCNTPPRHPGVLGYGWEDDAILSEGELLPGWQNLNVDRRMKTNWTFESVQFGGHPPATALIPHWYSQTGEYLFCYRIPGMDDLWKPIDYMTVLPRVDYFTPLNMTASPLEQPVQVRGEGLDTRNNMDAVKFVPAVMGTCDNHPDGDFVVWTNKIEPRQGGIGTSGGGLRGLTTVTSTGQTFAMAGVYRVCYASRNHTEHRRTLQPGQRACSLAPACGAFSGNCCPSDDGVWNDCCGPDTAKYIWQELPAPRTCATSTQYPSTWPAWYVSMISSCLPRADVAARKAPWVDDARPPCPDFYCNLLEVRPLVGSMIVEDHTTARDPPLLEVGVQNRIRVDGQGFSEGDVVYWIPGHRSSCDTLDPVSNKLSRSLRAYEFTPGTPWHGKTRGLPRGVFNNTFSQAGDYTLCVSFQFFPGLFVAAGNVTVENAVARMEWTVLGQDALLTPKITFLGGGLNRLTDSAMLVPSTGNGAVCNASVAVATTTNLQPGIPSGNATSATQWELPQGTLATGAYQTCYKLGGSSRGWSLLGGLIEVPYGNVPPGFDILSNPTDYGPPDNLHLYGPSGLGLNFSAPLATGMTTARGDKGVDLSWLPRETRQNMTFEVTIVSGSRTLFNGACVTRQSACLAMPTYNNQTLCVAAGCAYVGGVCTPPPGCNTYRDEATCAQQGCRWSPGQFPKVDPVTGYLSFAVGDAVSTGTVTVRLVLKDDGGTARGGFDASEPRELRITVTRGPEYTQVEKRIVMREDQPIFGRSIVSWSVSRIRGRQYAFEIVWDDPGAAAKYFSGGFTLQPAGTLDAVPSPDRNAPLPGLGFTLLLRDQTVGVAYSDTFSVVIEPVNDPPSFEVDPSYTAAPIWWKQGRAEPWSAKVLLFPDAGTCRTLQSSVCSRLYVAAGCPTAMPAFEFDCTTEVPCALRACTPTNNAVCSVLQDAALQACATDYVSKGCRGRIAQPCTPATECIEAACASAANSTLNLGYYESTQELLSMTATVPPSNESSFESGPTLDTNGALSFKLSPGASGTFVISFAAKDTGGTQNEGVDTFTSPSTMVVNTYYLPRLRVTPPTGGVALQTEFKMEALVSADDASGTQWQYTFMTIPNTQIAPPDLSSPAAISHSLAGPHRQNLVFTRDVPAGEHTVVLGIYRDGVLVDTSHAFVSVAAPDSSLLAASLDQSVASAGNGSRAIPLLAAVAATAAKSPDAKSPGVAKTLVDAVLKAVENLKPSPDGSVHNNAVATALSALRSSMLATVDAETLLAANDAFNAVHKKAGGGGMVTGFVGLEGMSLVGLTPAQVAQLERAVAQDLEKSYSVTPGSIGVSLSPQPDGSMTANFSVPTTPQNVDFVHATITNINNDKSLSMATTQDVYKALRANTPVVDYTSSTAAASARGEIAVNGIQFRGLSAAEKEMIKASIRNDLAQSFGVAPDTVLVDLVDTPVGKNAVKFVVNTRGSPDQGRGVQCAMIPACASNVLQFPQSGLTPNLTASTHRFDASGKVVLSDVSFGAMTPATAKKVQDAIRQDLAAAYGVDPSRIIDVTYTADPFSQGTVVGHSLNLTGLTDPGVQAAMVPLLAQSRLGLPLTRAALLAQTGVGVRYDAVGATPWKGAPVDGAIVGNFVGAAAAVIAAAPKSPGVWRTSTDLADSQSAANTTARDQANFALNKQLESLFSVIESSCDAALAKAQTQTRVDSPVSRTVQPTLAVEWWAVLGTLTHLKDEQLSSSLPTQAGSVTITSDRPTVDTCIVNVAFSKSPFISDGRPGYHPVGPVGSVRGKRLLRTSVESTMPAGSAPEVIAWNRGARKGSGEWGDLSGGTVGVSTAGKTTLHWPAGGSWKQRKPLQAGGDATEERIMASTLQARKNSDKCLPCVLVPVVVGLWLVLVIVGLCLHRKHLASERGQMTEEEKLLFCLIKKPTFASCCFRHHAWVAYFVNPPTLVQFYSRAERATVWFSVYFVAIGVCATFYDKDAVEDWEAHPTIDYGKAVLVCFAECASLPPPPKHLVCA